MDGGIVTGPRLGRFEKLAGCLSLQKQCSWRHLLHAFRTLSRREGAEPPTLRLDTTLLSAWVCFIAFSLVSVSGFESSPRVRVFKSYDSGALPDVRSVVESRPLVPKPLRGYHEGRTLVLEGMIVIR